MITREELHRLAQVQSLAGCAVSFYFQPQTPQDQTHRQETILVKDLVRSALRHAERSVNHQELRDDLHRVLRTAQGLYGNHSRGKAIFACRERGIWRELDLPPRLEQSQLKVDSRFYLRPLVAAQSGFLRTCIALLNSTKARIFEMERHGEELRQMPDLEFGPLSKTGRSDGYFGYEAGHRERHAENEIKSHFKWFADSLQMLLQRDHFDSLLIGCRDAAWHDLEPQLHPYVKQRLQGRLSLDPAAATTGEVRARALRVLEGARDSRRDALVREVIAEAKRNARGATGLRRVITALERQEAQAVIVGRGLRAEVSECVNCHHLDTRMVRRCAACGQATRKINDVTGALVDLALRNGAEIEFIEDDPRLAGAGHVGALLRFRADQNTPSKIAV